MRISSFQVHQQAVAQLQNLGGQAAATQQQIASGKKLVSPADDPVGAARLIGLNQELRSREQFIRNADAADAQIALEESVLQQVGSLVLRVQELTLQAGSGIGTNEDRQFLALEIEAKLEELTALANTQDANGIYIFAGYKGDTEPFQNNGQGIEYVGDIGQRRVEVAAGQFVAVNDPGSKVFSNLAALNISAAQKIRPQDSDANLEVSQIQVIDDSLAQSLFPHNLVVEFDQDPTNPNAWCFLYAVVAICA